MLVEHGGAYRDNRCVNGGFTLINLLRRFLFVFLEKALERVQIVLS